MTRVLLWDTNIWSHLPLGTPEKQAHVQARLAALALCYPGATRATSRICIAEALVAARRLDDPAAALAAEAALSAEFANPSLIVVEISDLLPGTGVQVADQAASLRAEALKAARRGGPEAGPDGGKLKLPDALIAASCLVFSPPAVLLTENTGDFQSTAPDGVSTRVAGLTVEGL